MLGAAARERFVRTAHGRAQQDADESGATLGVEAVRNVEARDDAARSTRAARTRTGDAARRGRCIAALAGLACLVRSAGAPTLAAVQGITAQIDARTIALARSVGTGSETDTHGADAVAAACARSAAVLWIAREVDAALAQCLERWTALAAFRDAELVVTTACPRRAAARGIAQPRWATRRVGRRADTDTADARLPCAADASTATARSRIARRIDARRAAGDGRWAAERRRIWRVEPRIEHDPARVVVGESSRIGRHHGRTSGDEEAGGGGRESTHARSRSERRAATPSSVSAALRRSIHAHCARWRAPSDGWSVTASERCTRRPAACTVLSDDPRASARTHRARLRRTER